MNVLYEPQLATRKALANVKYAVSGP
jgi:hypothetical protein